MESFDEPTAEPSRQKDIDDDDDDDDDNGDDGDSSSNDEPLFKFQPRAFKRSKEVDLDDSEPEGEGKSDDGSSGEMDDAFNSSPDSRRVSRSNADGAAAAGRSGCSAADLLVSSDDEDSSYQPVPKRRRKGSSKAEYAEKYEALFGDGFNSDEGGGGYAPKRVPNKDEAYARKMAREIADASNLDEGAASSRERSTAASRAAAGLAPTVSAETAARRAREKDAKSVKLVVTRGKGQRHAFFTILGRQVEAIEDGCRQQPNLLSRDEMDDDDVEIALFYEERKLESSETLRQAGITGGEVNLRLKVSGGGSGGGGGACALGTPITVRVRVEGGKTFDVGTTKATQFSAFMEDFCAKVGIPADRVDESVFVFDGIKLNPDSTPDGVEMDTDELIEAKFPVDLMNGVQAAPGEVTLGSPEDEKVVRKDGKGKGAARSRRAAASAASARPQGRAASRLAQLGARRSTRSGGSGSGRGGGGGASTPVKEPEVILLD